MKIPMAEPGRFRHGRLTVLHDPMPGALTALAVVAGAGARFDGALPGLAHVAEHMLFQGTARWDQGDLNRRAAYLGGEVDAETGHDDMTLSIEVFNEDVEPALELLAELLFRSRIPAERFAKERHVVADEIRSRAEDPANVAYERSWARFFDESLGHPICGTLTSLEHMTAASVRRFVRRHLVPENMVLCAAGGVSRAALRRALARSFPAATTLRRPRPPRVRVRGAGRTRFRRHDCTQAQVVRVAAGPLEDAAQVALSLALEVVGADPDARLFQEVRERLGLGYDVSADLEVGMGWSASLLAASAARQDARRLRDAVERVCREAGGGFTAEEVVRARRKVRHRLARLADSRLDRALTHAARSLAGRPSIATATRLLERTSHAAVEEAWRRHLRAPTLSAVLSA